MPKQKYWYVLHVYECPVCGGSNEYRERVYKKPPSYFVNHVRYDWCDAF